MPLRDGDGFPVPWEPKPGRSETEEERAQRIAQAMEERAAALARWETWQAIRRYLLVMLISALGGMFGSAVTLAILHN